MGNVKLHDTGTLLRLSDEVYTSQAREYGWKLEKDLPELGLGEGTIFLPVIRNCQECFYEGLTYWGSIVSFSADYFNRDSELFKRVLIKNK